MTAEPQLWICQGVKGKSLVFVPKVIKGTLKTVNLLQQDEVQQMWKNIE